MTQSDLTTRQHKAIAALLSESTLTAASKKAGINPRTLYRYLQLEPFRQALANTESQAIDAAARRLVGGLDLALDTLSDLMQEAESESVKRQAASDWAGHTVKLLELRVLDNRISDLERQVKK
jgi:hypothetical protein